MYIYTHLNFAQKSIRMEFLFLVHIVPGTDLAGTLTEDGEWVT